jgi:hypothetical protein
MEKIEKTAADVANNSIVDQANEKVVQDLQKMNWEKDEKMSSQAQQEASDQDQSQLDNKDKGDVHNNEQDQKKKDSENNAEPDKNEEPSEEKSSRNSKKDEELSSQNEEVSKQSGKSRISVNEEIKVEKNDNGEGNGIQEDNIQGEDVDQASIKKNEPSEELKLEQEIVDLSEYVKNEEKKRGVNQEKNTDTSEESQSEWSSITGYDNNSIHKYHPFDPQTEPSNQLKEPNAKMTQKQIHDLQNQARIEAKRNELWYPKKVEPTYPRLERIANPEKFKNWPTEEEVRLKDVLKKVNEEKAAEKRQKLIIKKTLIYDEDWNLLLHKLNYPDWLPNIKTVTKDIFTYKKEDIKYIGGLLEVLLELHRYYDSGEWTNKDLNFPLSELLPMISCSPSQRLNHKLSHLKIKGSNFDEFNFKLWKEYVKYIDHIDKQYPRKTPTDYNIVIDKISQMESEKDLPYGEDMKLFEEVYQQMRKNLEDVHVRKGKAYILPWIVQCIKKIDKDKTYGDVILCRRRKRVEANKKPRHPRAVNRRKRDQKRYHKRKNEWKDHQKEKQRQILKNKRRWDCRRAKIRNDASYHKGKTDHKYKSGHMHTCNCDEKFLHKTGKLIICTRKNCKWQCRNKDHSRCHQNCKLVDCKSKYPSDVCHSKYMKVYRGCIKMVLKESLHPTKSIDQVCKENYLCLGCYRADRKHGKIDWTMRDYFIDDFYY